MKLNLPKPKPPSDVVTAVQVVKAIQRIPEGSTHTFFGAFDLWRYHAIFDVKLCADCLLFAEVFYFAGNYLRDVFPYLQIASDNVIEVRVHPNCRCELHRITDVAEYLMVLEQLGR